MWWIWTIILLLITVIFYFKNKGFRLNNYFLGVYLSLMFSFFMADVSAYIRIPLEKRLSIPLIKRIIPGSGIYYYFKK